MCRVFWPLYLKFLGFFFNFPDFKCVEFFGPYISNFLVFFSIFQISNILGYFPF